MTIRRTQQQYVPIRSSSLYSPFPSMPLLISSPSLLRSHKQSSHTETSISHSAFHSPSKPFLHPISYPFTHSTAHPITHPHFPHANSSSHPPKQTPSRGIHSPLTLPDIRIAERPYGSTFNPQPLGAISHVASAPFRPPPRLTAP